MNTLTSLLTSVALVTGVGHATAQLLDGSFELAEPGTTNSNSAWTLVESAPDGLGAIFQDSFAASDGENGVWFRSFTGTSAVPTSALLSQTMNNVAGGDYWLTFDAAREEHFAASTWIATFSSSGGLMSSIDLNTAPMNGPPSNMFANPTTFVLPLLGVTAGDDLTITVEMTGGTLALNNPQSAFVDNFRLLVPEPSSLVFSALGLVALAGMGLFRGKRPC